MPLIHRILSVAALVAGLELALAPAARANEAC